ncbi:MAG: hypothetical protein AB7N24_10990 [Dehalococcoidia bacterium]
MLVPFLVGFSVAATLMSVREPPASLATRVLAATGVGLACATLGLWWSLGHFNFA